MRKKKKKKKKGQSISNGSLSPLLLFVLPSHHQFHHQLKTKIKNTFQTCSCERLQLLFTEGKNFSPRQRSNGGGSGGFSHSIKGSAQAAFCRCCSLDHSWRVSEHQSHIFQLSHTHIQPCCSIYGVLIRLYNFCLMLHSCLSLPVYKTQHSTHTRQTEHFPPFFLFLVHCQLSATTTELHLTGATLERT